MVKSIVGLFVSLEQLTNNSGDAAHEGSPATASQK